DGDKQKQKKKPGNRRAKFSNNGKPPVDGVDVPGNANSLPMRNAPEIDNPLPLRTSYPPRADIAAHNHHAVPDKIKSQIVPAWLVAGRGRQSGLFRVSFRRFFLFLFLFIRRQWTRANPALARLPLPRRGPWAEDQQSPAAFDVTPHRVLNLRRRRAQIVAGHHHSVVSRIAEPVRAP